MQELTASLTELQRWLLAEGKRLLESTDYLRCQSLTAAQKLILSQQLEWRRRCRERFPQPDKWLWSDRSLSQASDWWSASYKAALFPTNICIVDGCCGAGVDSVALTDSRDVISVDSDPWMVALTDSNAASHGTRVRGFAEFLTRTSLRGSKWLHVDPDRRATGRRTLEDKDFSPSLFDVLDLATSVSGAVIKIAPSTKLSDACKQIIDKRGTRLWLGSRGECRQQLILVGDPSVESLARKVREQSQAVPDPSLPHATAVLLTKLESVPTRFSETYYVGNTLTQFSSEHWVSDELGPYMMDLNSTLFAANLHRNWAVENNLTPFYGEYGFYTGHEFNPSPWASGFEVLDNLPWDDRKIRKWLKAHDAGLVEVKNRLVKLDANVYQRRYSQSQGQPIALLVTRLGAKVRCLICRRLGHTKESCCP